MNMKQIKDIIAAANLADDTVIIQGPHGIGKSSIVKQFAKENNHQLIELFLSHQEVGDVIGIPKIVNQGNESLTTWTKPIWLQRMIDAAWPTSAPYESLSFKDDDIKHLFTQALPKSYNATDSIDRETVNSAYATIKGLDAGTLHLVDGQTDISCSLSRHSTLFLDELNRAPIDVRQSALQLVLEKQIHEHMLPRVNGKAAMIVAAINPADQYQVDELDDALLDRFLFVEAEADAKSWLEYARNAGLNEVVRNFISEHPNRLFWQPQDGGVGATPRSWEKLAGFMDKAAQIDNEIMFPIAKGKIGSEVGSQFIQYFNNYSKVVKMEDIEALIEKESTRAKKVQTIAKKVAKLIEKQEPIQKTELIQQFMDKYLDKPTEEAQPLLAYMYALDIELLAAFLKTFKEEHLANYLKLAAHDKDNKKELFTKIISKVSNEK